MGRLKKTKEQMWLFWSAWLCRGKWQKWQSHETFPEQKYKHNIIVENDMNM